MSIKNLAREFYRAQQNVERLEKLLLSTATQDEEAIRGELQDAQAERLQLQKMIDGRKDFSPLPRRF